MEILLLLGVTFLILNSTKAPEPLSEAPEVDTAPPEVDTAPPEQNAAPEQYAADVPAITQTENASLPSEETNMDLLTTGLLIGGAYLVTKDREPIFTPPANAGGYQPPAASDSVPALSPSAPPTPDTYVPPEYVADLPTAGGGVTEKIAVPNDAQPGSYEVWIEPYNPQVIESGTLPYNPYNPDFQSLVKSGVYDRSVWLHYIYWTKHYLQVWDDSSFAAYGGKAAYWEKVKSVLSAVLTPAEIGSV